MKRRSFLKTLALGSLSAAALKTSLSAKENPKKIPVSVQLFCVREAAEKDLKGSLEKIAKIGYDGVEFAGYYGNDPKEIRKMLDDNGLKCSGTHTGLDQCTDALFEKTLETHRTLGTRFLIVPWLPLETLDDVRRIAGEMNRLVEKAKTYDVAMGYHAHGGDARLIDGKTVWEFFCDSTSKEILLQMDIGNFMSGGGDPYKMIEKYKGRSKSVHLKETDGKIIGSGQVDWKRIFELCETVGGTQWYVVEDEATPNSFDRIAECRQALKKAGF